MEWIEKFTRHIGRSNNLSEEKKELLSSIIDRITTGYDEENKVHKITLKFKIPVTFKGVKSDEIPSKNLKIFKKFPRPTLLRSELLHRNRLRQIPRLIHITSAHHSNVIGQ